MLLLNAFYLQEEAARGRLAIVDETLAKAVRLGASLVRAWAFNDSPSKRDDTAIQIGRLVYREEGLDGVDLVLARARAHGLRLILALGDHWSSYGGVQQWCRWNGMADAVEGDPRFYSDERVRAHYREHCARLLGRKNRITNICWGEDDTVFAWELLNEPRGDGGLIADWAGFAARSVRAHAGQLVAVGGEGHDPDGFRALLAVPELDLASVHLYPDKQGLADPVGFLLERGRLAAAAGKPIYCGELGLSSARPVEERRAAYRRWLGACAEGGYLAAGPWGFSYDSRPAAWDEFTFYVGDYDEVLRSYA